ncbi:uncharacterized protein TNCT_551371 [Trichonephila clavata]|uniref:Uncharacterized protein n=1 Tax=Trichonephila clavata TaxID=2740835 RepID=A0A8X6KBB5_TRICU|nr:uncharacterized protein TNCT_514771 [Trichonephila clavata]GFR23326.1 uncharacterized protein TNCT_551371 [Trichonephila clavata]
MKRSILLFTLLGFVTLTLGQNQSPLANMFDSVRNIFHKMLGGDNSLFAQILDQALVAFKFDDWKEKIPAILEQKATELSKRGQREFEQAMGKLDVMKEDPNTTKEDFLKVLQELQSSGQ